MAVPRKTTSSVYPINSDTEDDEPVHTKLAGNQDGDTTSNASKAKDMAGKIEFGKKTTIDTPSGYMELDLTKTNQHETVYPPEVRHTLLCVYDKLGLLNLSASAKPAAERDPDHSDVYVIWKWEKHMAGGGLWGQRDDGAHEMISVHNRLEVANQAVLDMGASSHASQQDFPRLEEYIGHHGTWWIDQHGCLSLRFWKMEGCENDGDNYDHGYDDEEGDDDIENYSNTRFAFGVNKVEMKP